MNLFLLLSYIDCSYGINLSFFPCKIKVGQYTFFIYYKLVNRSLISKETTLPTRSLTNPLIDVNGDTRTKQAGLVLDAR